MPPQLQDSSSDGGVAKTVSKAMILSDDPHIAVVPNSSSKEICEGRKSNLTTSAHTTGYEKNPWISLDTETSGPVFTARKEVFRSEEYEISLLRNVDDGKLGSSFCKLKDAQYPHGKIIVEETDKVSENSETEKHWFRRLDFDTNVSPERLNVPDKSNYGKCEVGFTNRNSKYESNCSAKICRKGKLVNRSSSLVKMSEKQREAIICPKDSVTLESEMGSLTSYTSKLCSLKVDKTDDNKEVDVVHDQHVKSSRTFDHRKRQKVRFLTDIIRSELSGASGEIPRLCGFADSSIINAPVSYTEAADENNDVIRGTLFRNQVAFHENDQRGKKKRKRLQVEGSHSFQLGLPIDASKDFKKRKSDEENNCIDAVIAGSTSKGNATALMNSDNHSACRTHLDRSWADGLVPQSKKLRTEGRETTLKPSQENLQKKFQLTSGDVKCKETRVETLQFDLRKDQPTKRGICRFLKCNSAAQVCDEKYTSCIQRSSGRGSSMPLIVSKNVQVSPDEATSFSSSFAPDAFDESGSSHLNLKKITYSKPKNLPPPFTNGKDTNSRGHSEVTQNQSSGEAKKVFEPEGIDDIPMEIVELLAKNRRERRILEAEEVNRNKICTEATMSSKDARRVDLIKAHGDEKLRYPLDENFQMQRKYINAGHRTFNTDRRVHPAEPTFINCTSYNKEACTNTASNLPGLEEYHEKNEFSSCTNSQENRSGANNPESRWDGVGDNCPLACMQFAKAEPKLSIVSCPSQCSEAHNVSISDVEAGPIKSDSFHKYANFSKVQSKNIDAKISKNINAEQACVCIQKKIENCPKLVGPLDLYANETITAKQLLRLADQGMSSRASPNVVSPKRSLSKNHTSVNGLKKAVPLNAKSTVSPIVSQLIKADVEVNEEAGTSSPSKVGPRTEMCSFNRNPADFSIPDAGNKFMRSEDFKLRNEIIPKQGRPSYNRPRYMNPTIGTCVS